MRIDGDDIGTSLTRKHTLDSTWECCLVQQRAQLRCNEARTSRFCRASPMQRLHHWCRAEIEISTADESRVLQQSSQLQATACVDAFANIWVPTHMSQTKSLN
jgi:hypothetical protein